MKGYVGAMRGGCSASHKPLRISVSGKDFFVRGGSCIYGTVTDNNFHNCDVFVGLDCNMVRTERRYPWNLGEEFLFPIDDYGVPSSVVEFRKMIKYLSGKITEGSSVFVGCHAGHGRTGMVLAALVRVS